MKKILMAMIAFVVISISATAQVGSKVAANGCGTDCFFTDCTVSCPGGSIPKCKCILGSFGSCGCTQTYRTSGAKSDTYELPLLRNSDKKSNVLEQLRKNGFDEYASYIDQLFNALSSKNLDSYNQGYTVLESLIKNNPEIALQVEKIISESVK